jgi:outer membrane lipoprotein-sorting protein
MSTVTAEEVFKQFQARYQKSRNFRADFEEISFMSSQKSITKGKLVFQKPNMLRKEYQDPNDTSKISQLILSNGKIIWSYTPWLNQATRQELKNSEAHREFLPGIGSSLEKLKAHYDLSLFEDPIAKKKGVYVLQLTPKKGIKGIKGINDPAFDAIQAWIRPSDWMPLQFSYEDKKSNMTLIISFNEKTIRVDEKLNNSIFEFQPPKGIEIIDVPD